MAQTEKKYYGVWVKTKETWLMMVGGEVFNTPSRDVAKAQLECCGLNPDNLEVRAFGDNGKLRR